MILNFKNLKNKVSLLKNLRIFIDKQKKDILTIFNYTVEMLIRYVKVNWLMTDKKLNFY